MKQRPFAAALLSIIPLTLAARIEVLESGHVVIGPKQVASDDSGLIRPTQPFTPDTSCPLSVISNGYNHTGGLISFGNKGGVKLGESMTDNQLYMFAPKGIFFNAGAPLTGSETTIFSYVPNGIEDYNTFNFNCQVKMKGNLITSDARSKNSIVPIEGQAEGLSLLTPVSYYLNSETEGDGEVAKVSVKGTASEAHRKFGFLAQEVREVYPDLVYEDEEGMLSLDYIGFIPLLVESVQKLQAKVERQEEVISVLTAENVALRAPGTAGVSVTGDVKARLCQNRPNPTSGATVIDYTLPETTGNAFIGVYDLTGSQKMHIALEQRGKSSVTIEEGALQPGLYIYNLVADGQEVGSYRMVVTE